MILTPANSHFRFVQQWEDETRDGQRDLLLSKDDAIYIGVEAVGIIWKEMSQEQLAFF